MSQEKRLALCQQIIDGPVEPIKAFIEPKTMKLIPALLNDLGDRGPGTATLVAQQCEQSDCGTADFLGQINECRHVKWGKQHRQSRNQYYSWPNYLIRTDLQVKMSKPIVSDGHDNQPTGHQITSIDSPRQNGADDHEHADGENSGRRQNQPRGGSVIAEKRLQQCR